MARQTELPGPLEKGGLGVVISSVASVVHLFVCLQFHPPGLSCGSSGSRRVDWLGFTAYMQLGHRDAPIVITGTGSMDSFCSLPSERGQQFFQPNVRSLFPESAWLTCALSLPRKDRDSDSRLS